MPEALNLFEAELLRSLRTMIASAPLDRLFRVITDIGEKGAVWILIALVLLMIPRTRRAGVAMCIAMLTCLIFGNLILKNLVARPRPFQVDPNILLAIPPPREYSFPSGHTMNGFAASGALWRYSRRAGLAALSLAALIGFTRLYFCVHYPTDVLAGALFGWTAGLLSWRVLEWAERKRASRRV